MQHFITWGPVLALCLLALWLARQPYGRMRERRRERTLIRNASVAQLSDVLLDDGIGGKSLFDHLLLTPQGILVLLRRPCVGALFAGERMDLWAQVMGKKTYRFANPLHALDESLATLRFHLPKLPLEGGVLFCGRCEFPKGRPARILLLEELAARAAGVNQAVQPVLEQGWQLLCARAEPAGEAGNRDEKERGDRGRLAAAVLLLLLGGGWTLWRLLPL